MSALRALISSISSSSSTGRNELGETSLRNKSQLAAIGSEGSLIEGEDEDEFRILAEERNRERGHRKEKKDWALSSSRRYLDRSVQRETEREKERGRRKRGRGVVRRSNLLAVEKGSRDPRSKYWDTVSLGRVNLRAQDESSR